MYGTIGRFRPKPGKEQDVFAYLEDWKRTRGPNVKGHVGGYLYKPEQHPEELILAVVFQDKESYFANASDPEQDRWYRRLRDLLDVDPTWEDGEAFDESSGTRAAGR